MGLKNFAVLTGIFAVILAVIANIDPENSYNPDLNSTQYDLDLKVYAPRLAGRGLAFFGLLARSWPTGSIINKKILNDNGLYVSRKFAALLDVPPTFYPISPAANAKSDEKPIDLELLLVKSETQGFRFPTAIDYVDGYKSGKFTPIDVVKAVLEAIDQTRTQSPPSAIFVEVHADDVILQAEASRKRYKEGKTLSPLDGVPIAIKDELNVAGYKTTVGTKFLNDIQPKDSTVVARLRAAGAIIIGKTNMHEIGLGVTGANIHHGFVRNPYNTSRYTGGSSAGSAAAVASGLVPIAIGADGGGSIRLPACLTGIVGLKATFARISEHGAASLCWSVGHIGPMTTSVGDAALVYAIIGGPDGADPNTLHQPPLSLQSVQKIDDLSGVRIGYFKPHVEDSDADVLEAFYQTKANLEKLGAKFVEIKIPNLFAMYRAHTTIIISEMATVFDQKYKDTPQDFSPELQVSLGLARELSSRDYISALKIRTYAMQVFEKIFKEYNIVAIVSPTSGSVAPEIQPDALELGESDLPTTIPFMRYLPIGNLVGGPAISVPVGYSNGLPIGFQIYGQHWDEATVLRLAGAVEKHGAPLRQAPQTLFNIIKLQDDVTLVRRVGGLSDVATPDQTVKSLVELVKPQLETKLAQHLQHAPGENTIEVLAYRKQLVAGTNYFVKLSVGSSIVHARIFSPLASSEGEPQVISVLVKTEQDEIEFF